MRPSRPFRNATGGALLGLLAGIAAPAGAAEVWGSAGTLLVKQEGSYRLTTEGGEVEFEVPSQVRLDELFPLRQQTLLCGVANASGERLPGDELYLAVVDAAGAREIDPPPGRPAGVSRERAVAIRSASGELAAVAWLEGASRRSNSVRVATWNGRSFEAPSEVASRGPGSQAALAAAALDDGGTLLVWARFDGADDEIFWSRFADGRWSEPKRAAADNAVPDVVPAIVAVPGGALLAWSRYGGGEYRIVVARYLNGEWSDPVPAGEPGSVFPTLVRTASGALLLHQSSRPRGWAVLELSAEGHEVRRAFYETDERSRPVVSEERLRWADRSVALTWRDAASSAKP